jgi:hypothetical protein
MYIHEYDVGEQGLINHIYFHLLSIRILVIFPKWNTIAQDTLLLFSVFMYHICHIAIIFCPLFWGVILLRLNEQNTRVSSYNYLPVTITQCLVLRKIGVSDYKNPLLIKMGGFFTRTLSWVLYWGDLVNVFGYHSSTPSNYVAW